MRVATCLSKEGKYSTNLASMWALAKFMQSDPQRVRLLAMLWVQWRAMLQAGMQACLQHSPMCNFTMRERARPYAALLPGWEYRGARCPHADKHIRDAGSWFMLRLWPNHLQ